MNITIKRKNSFTFCLIFMFLSTLLLFQPKMVLANHDCGEWNDIAKSLIEERLELEKEKIKLRADVDVAKAESDAAFRKSNEAVDKYITTAGEARDAFESGDLSKGVAKLAVAVREKLEADKLVSDYNAKLEITHKKIELVQKHNSRIKSNNRIKSLWETKVIALAIEHRKCKAINHNPWI